MKKYLSILMVLVFCVSVSVSSVNGIITYAAESMDSNTALSTEDLIEKIIFEDKLDEVYLFDDFRMGIAYYKTHNRLFVELISRDDCGTKLISMYNALSGSSEEQALNIARFLLQQYEIYSKLSFTEKTFVDSFQNISTIAEINAAQTLSNTEASYVYTPNGSAVAVEERDYITEDEDLDSNYIANEATNYGVISTISAPTTKYNCHSFAWYSQNYNLNCYWMDDPSTYYSDSSYISSDAAENYILCYYAKTYYTLLDGTLISSIVTVNSHSAIITHVGSNFNKNDSSTLDSIMVTSKWGAWGLYEHYGDDCPYVRTSKMGTYLPYIDENGEEFSVPVYFVSEFSHVEVYRPRTNASYTLSASMNDVATSRNVNGDGSITDKYGMYELNVTSAGQYTITIQSDHALSNRLYNANMNLMPMTSPASSTGTYAYAVNLSAGRYYLRTAYSDLTNSGTISITIEPHSHSYDWWTYYNSTTHIESCCCGRIKTATAVHSIRASEVVNNKANCMGCGYMLDLRYDVAVSIPDSVMKVSVNGSYILPSGIIVLVDEDVEAYLNGTLVFYDKDDLPVTQ